MQIRRKLTLQFVFIVALILAIYSILVYYFSSNYREEDFYSRLKNRALNVANLLIDIDEVDSVLLEKIEKDNPLSLPHEKIVVFNYKNEILFSSDTANVFKINSDLLDGVRLNREIRFRQESYEMLGFLYTSKYNRFVIIAGAIDIYGLKKLVNLLTVLSIGFGVCVVIIFISGNIYSKRALLPISNIINQVNGINVNNMNTRLDEGNKKDELAQLAETFNRMLDRIVSAFTVQKNFIANASHELRTPLTMISGQLEVSLLQNRSAEYYRETIISVLDDVKKINLIAERLLLLAQASAESEAAFRPLRVDELLWQTKTELTKVNDLWSVYITFDPELDENDLTICGNEQLVRSALFNLMENACKFSSDHKAEIYLTGRNESLDIRIMDNGIGISPEDMEHIFEPFHRGKNVQHINGHGIGLSLVQKIIQLHKGSITIQSQLEKGTVATIYFPSRNF